MVTTDETQEHIINNCDRRLLRLESRDHVIEGDLGSLRSSRHEYGNWLNRHNLEINEARLKVIEINGQLSRTEKTMESIEVRAAQFMIDVTAQLSKIHSDIRITTWKVATMIGLLVFIATRIANHYGL